MLTLQGVICREIQPSWPHQWLNASQSPFLPPRRASIITAESLSLAVKGATVQFIEQWTQERCFVESHRHHQVVTLLAQRQKVQPGGQGSSLDAQSGVCLASGYDCSNLGMCTHLMFIAAQGCLPKACPNCERVAGPAMRRLKMASRRPSASTLIALKVSTR